ncbi:peptidoglycan DD-metalloendopeptidase family protein, partial [Rosettibacter firmus]|uniref:peptidoglycan DD-metalloendopeptidase family protein n=1 Tax=Rosettibacter firmus TaxID=3111522 RepID=UPI00336BE078
NTFGSGKFYLSVSFTKNTTIKNYPNCVYYLDGNVWVIGGATLTIESGVQVNLGNYNFHVGYWSSESGVLQANGVTFTGSGNGILQFEYTATGQLIYCEFAYQLKVNARQQANVVINQSNFGVMCSVENTSSIVLNAKNNYWGDPSGPKHSTNPNGQGARVSDKVDFIPFKTSLIPTILYWPVTETYTVTQDYGAYNEIGNSKYHTGIDLVTSNRLVVATFSGTVHSIKNNTDGWGNAIIINHGEGIYSLYAHLASFAQNFSIGQLITVGQLIGTMGSTGNVTGVHLHFEVKTDGSWGNGYTDDIPDGYGYKDPRLYILPFFEADISPVVVRVTSNDTLDVRSGPSPEYALLTRLIPNQRYVAYKANSNWYKIYLPNASGPISGWSISTSSLTEEPTARYLQIINTGGTGLFVRTEAGTNFPPVKTKNGFTNLKVWDDQRFPIIDQTTVGGVTWYKIDLPTLASQSQGWISGDFVTGIVNSDQTIPEYFLLRQNYPNPFNLSTTISFDLPSKSFVSLKVFDVLGKEVSNLVSEELPAGTYSRQWNAVGLASGIYFYRLQAGSFIETKKLILMK